MRALFPFWCLVAISGCEWTATLGIFPLQPPFYLADPIDALVVDVDSGLPVPGATVMADWRLEGPHGQFMGQMALMETTTKSDGSFHLDGWGPRIRPLVGYLRQSAPRILVVHHSYGAYVFVNPAPGGIPSRAVSRTSIWNGKPLKVRKCELHECASGHALIESVLPELVGYRCRWKSIPLLLGAVFGADAARDAWQLRTLKILEEWNRPFERWCGNPRDFLKRA